MSITKLTPNWACQMGPIHCPKFLLSGTHGFWFAEFDDKFFIDFPRNLVKPSNTLIPHHRTNDYNLYQSVVGMKTNLLEPKCLSHFLLHGIIHFAIIWVSITIQYN